MKFQYRYYGHSGVSNDASSTDMRFAPDTLRKPTHFVAEVGKHIPFREAISALHDVVVADERFQPPDKTAYLAWLQKNESALLAEFMGKADDLRQRMEPIKKELQEVRAEQSRIMQPFYTAQKKYFDWLYKANRDAWIVLDPIITVHPDKVFFECFSRDESSYASLSCSHDVFKRVGDFACGTTNIDYSEGLYTEFQKIRDYKTTRLAIEPGGFQVQTADDPAFVEQKIDVPETWVRGLLQVSSAMNLPAHKLQLHPMDVHNFCLLLRRKKERVGPRSMRFILKPGEPVRVLFEPWNTELICRRSIYEGKESGEVRMWGRRRLLVLERLIAVANSFTVHLLGTGLPSFWVANLPDMQVTLGLSGWTANDWSRLGQFDLLSPRGTVDDDSKSRVFAALSARWFASADQLAQDTGLARTMVESALTLYTQAGRVIYDLTQQVYRLRELSREPLPLDTLRFSSPLEQQAEALLVAKTLRKTGKDAQADGGILLKGTSSQGKRDVAVALRLDADLRIVDGNCSCDHYIRNRMHKGPCEHMLALRMADAAETVLGAR
jgi:predicted nucleic acid-binding Zn finger protein